MCDDWRSLNFTFLRANVEKTWTMTSRMSRIDCWFYTCSYQWLLCTPAKYIIMLHNVKNSFFRRNWENSCTMTYRDLRESTTDTYYFYIARILCTPPKYIIILHINIRIALLRYWSARAASCHFQSQQKNICIDLMSTVKEQRIRQTRDLIRQLRQSLSQPRFLHQNKSTLPN
jgi:hypothetical protein